jgi:hypothetical protein
MSDRRFGRSGSDAALEVTKQLREVLHAEVLDVDTDHETTIVFLSVPKPAVARVIRVGGSTDRERVTG